MFENEAVFAQVFAEDDTSSYSTDNSSGVDEELFGSNAWDLGMNMNGFSVDMPLIPGYEMPNIHPNQVVPLTNLPPLPPLGKKSVMYSQTPLSNISSALRTSISLHGYQQALQNAAAAVSANINNTVNTNATTKATGVKRKVGDNYEAPAATPAVADKKPAKRKRTPRLSVEEKANRKHERQIARRQRKSVREKERRNNVNQLFEQMSKILGLPKGSTDRRTILTKAIETFATCGIVAPEETDSSTSAPSKTAVIPSKPLSS